MNGFTTKAVHGARTRKDPHGSLRGPLYDSVAFEFDTAHDAELAFAGKKPAHAYSRITNPTVEEFELRIRLLSDSFGVVAVSSGMAAIADTVMALAESGSNIVTSRHLFGHTLALFESTLGRWGLEVRFVDMTSPASVDKAIDGRTRLVFLESITNPQLEVADIGEICTVASRRNVPVVLDGTLTTPYLFRSKDAGVAVEVLSSTKYISGGATSVGGLIIDNGVFDWKRTPALRDLAAGVGPGALLVRLRRDVYRNLGACLSPHNAWLQTLGLETMALRIERSCANAFAIARFLQQQPQVRRVNYPGIGDSPSYEHAVKQFRRGFGGILTFDLADRTECFALMDRLTLIRKATNLNDNKTLIIHPSSTIFCDFSAQQKAEMGVTDSTIRLSAGIEDAEDLTGDIRQALEAL
jgi:O-acetylhomoserine (thiol)-lyase